MNQPDSSALEKIQIDPKNKQKFQLKLIYY